PREGRASRAAAPRCRVAGAWRGRARIARGAAGAGERGPGAIASAARDARAERRVHRVGLVGGHQLGVGLLGDRELGGCGVGGRELGDRGVGDHAMSRRLDLYVGLVTAAGVLSVAIAAITLRISSLDPLMFALLVILAAVAQRIPVFLFRSSAISVSFAAAFAASVLYGPAPRVVVRLSQSVVNSVTPRRKPARKVAFNFGSFTLSALVAGIVYHLVGGLTPPAAL